MGSLEEFRLNLLRLKGVLREYWVSNKVRSGFPVTSFRVNFLPSVIPGIQYMFTSLALALCGSLAP